jgi:hypothetical protein
MVVIAGVCRWMPQERVCVWSECICALSGPEEAQWLAHLSRCLALSVVGPAPGVCCGTGHSSGGALACSVLCSLRALGYVALPGQGKGQCCCCLLYSYEYCE